MHRGTRLYAPNTTDSIHDPVISGTLHSVRSRGKLSRQPDVGRLALAGERGILPIMDPITVFIAEAHIVLWQSLRRFLGQQRDLQVVGEANDGRQVLRRVEALQPDLLLLDLQMPELDGRSMLPRIRIKSPRTRILLLADYFAEDFIAGALQVGVHGCVLKTAPPTELLKAIRTIHAGELWASRKLLTQVVENLRQQMDESEGFLLEMWGTLTDREQEVIIWATEGMTNREVATQLGISAKTVKTHLQNVFRKLNVRRRAHLLRFRFTSLLPREVSPPSSLRRGSRA